MRLDIRKTVLAAALVALAAVAAFSVQGVSALLADSPAVPANDFTTASCWAAVESRQVGNTTSTADGIVTVPITAVNRTRSFLVFHSRSNLNRPVTQIRGRIATSTTLEFERVTDEATPTTVNIRWYVVEFACGVNVQHGSTTLSAATTNVPITPVAALDQAFVTWSKTPAAADASTDQNDALVAELTTTSNLQLRANTVPSGHVVWWQVIEFTNPADIDVQTGTTTMLGTATSRTVTLPTAVDPAKTFVLVSFQTSGTGADIGARMLRAQLTNSTTLTIDRSVSGTPDDITEIFWQTVELEGASVQRGTMNFPSADGSQSVTLSPSVDTTRAIVFASVNLAGGLSGGRTPYVTDDIVGVASFSPGFASTTQITIQRNNTAASADVGWFVVQFR
jgi:hypothetical protein